MTENNGQGFASSVKRFSGKGADAAEDYRRWRRWSRAYLVTQRARGLTPESVGSLLYTLLDDIALKSVDGIDFDRMEETGGEHLLYDLLDERFPEQEAHDKIGAALDSVFGLHIDKGERMAEFTGRCKEVFDVAEREGIPFPSVAKGYMVLRGARLTLDRKAVVLASSRKSYELNDIASSLRSTFPTMIHEGGKHHTGVHLTNEDIEFDEELTTEEEIDALVAEQEDLPAGTEVIDEREAITILATWKETRTNITKEKLARGFGPPKPDMAGLKRRVKCYNCQEVGHFSRDCPKKKKDKGAGKGGRRAVPRGDSSTYMVTDCGCVDGGVCDESQIDIQMPEGPHTPRVRPICVIRRGCWRTAACRCRHCYRIACHKHSTQNRHCARCVECVPEGSDSSASLMVTFDGYEDGGDDDEVDALMLDWQQDGQQRDFGYVSAEEESEIDSLLTGWQDDQGNFPEFVRQARQHRRLREEEHDLTEENAESTSDTFFTMVHALGSAVVDTGCGKALVGDETLEAHCRLGGIEARWLDHRPVRFRYGNGHVDTSIGLAEIPAWIAGKTVTLRLHVVKGRVPLLLSKAVLKSLRAHIDLVKNRMRMDALNTEVDLDEAPSGHYQINILDRRADSSERSLAVLLAQPSSDDDGVSVLASGFR